MKIIFQISIMMHETWIGTKNCQIVTVFSVNHNLPTPQNGQNLPL
jgi:hypothetical protein